jgi:hypothetical protein
MVKLRLRSNDPKRISWYMVSSLPPEEIKYLESRPPEELLGAVVRHLERAGEIFVVFMSKVKDKEKIADHYLGQLLRDLHWDIEEWRDFYEALYGGAEKEEGKKGGDNG